jgi:hypothetical protein
VVSCALLEKYDECASERNQIRRLAQHADGLYAGIPLPLEGHPLVIEPGYPAAAEIMRMGAKDPEERTLPPHIKKRGSFWSSHKRSLVLIWSEHDRIHFGIEPGIHHIAQDLRSLGASAAWGIEQEASAVQLLAEHVSHRQMKHYLLTGMFIETSPRSRVSYVFRRLRPTVALSTRGDAVKILCAMCLHPIGYYEGCWAGAMCPTDDVISHLMLMRGDERMFWSRANQHCAYRPEAAL